ncbi:hypothetical protein [Bacillus suaedaesalsae]|uniref:Swarming motility protein SwrB n=1 Tax=Bacillus suaedaesalsae TaxID=2810349 RepID=A0ABS2DJ28_9BACI|nr:hypothetical protein [Bacillus suaedaesalsae]MBM6618417.1 hypothetical protein [Bacillus suaedaesalsae]
MSTFLLVVSFILHVISFLSIVLLYFRIEKMRDIERKQASIMKDMEDILSSYILEMKEENEKFIQEVKTNNDKPKKSTKKTPAEKSKKASPKIEVAQAKIDTIEDEISNEDLMELLPTFKREVKTKPQQPHIMKDNEITNDTTDKKESKTVEEKIKEKEEPKEPPFESLPLNVQVQLLSKEGLTVEEIAKRLNKGKTEIELFLKFNT